jgi:hypothetical protein
MFTDRSMRIFVAHLAAFVAGVLICAAVNLWLTPNRLWSPWVLIGWGAVVATHDFALLMGKTRRRERIFIDKCARSFTVHLFAYVAAVLILFFVNLTLTPKVWWFYWVALGWGAGLIPHGWSAFFRRRHPAPTSAPAKTAKPEPAKAKTKLGTPPKRTPHNPRRKKPNS